MPPKRQGWLAKELKYDPRLLDYNPKLLWDLANTELLPGQCIDGRWHPGVCAAANVAYDHRVETLVAKERWRWFCGFNPCQALA